MRIQRHAYTTVFAVSGFLTAFLLSWVLLARADFLYPVWHDHGGIAEGIEKYGPQNRYRKGFGATTRVERIRLFAAINRAVHHGGAGLADIDYISSSEPVSHPLLREAEIVHLQDVARLITMLKWVSGAAAIVWLGCIAYALARRRLLPALRHQLIGMGIVVVIVALVLMIVGPVNVFNQLHIWIFPAENQWFFYYQDSLMSTLMLAPVLFGWIAAVWIPLGLVLFIVLQWLAGKAVRVRCKKHRP